jgi:hypothetical protein
LGPSIRKSIIMTFAVHTNQGHQPFLTQEQKDAMIQNNAETNAMIKLGLWKKQDPQPVQAGTPVMNQPVPPTTNSAPIPTTVSPVITPKATLNTPTEPPPNVPVNPQIPETSRYNFQDDNILEELFKERVNNKPQINEADQKRLKARGWMDALGRVAINVGDQLTLGAGGNPVLRKPSNDDSFDKYYKNQSDHQKAVEDWQTSDYLRRLRAGMALTDKRNQDRNFQQRADEVKNRNDQWQKEQDALNQYRKDSLGQQKDELTARTKQQKDDKALQWAEFNNKYPKEIVFDYDTSQGSQKLVIPRAEYPAKLKKLYNQATSDLELSQYAPQLFEQVKVGTEKKTDPETGLSSDVPVYSTQLTKEALSNPEIIIQAWLSKGGKAMTPKWQNEGIQTPQPVNIINTPGIEQYITPEEQQDIDQPTTTPSFFQ